MLDKSGKNRRNYIVGKHPFGNPILLLKFKDHGMLYDENIEFNNRVYPNTFHLLEALSQNRTLWEITMKDKAILESQMEVYIEKLHEISYHVMIQDHSSSSRQTTGRTKTYRVISRHIIHRRRKYN